MAQRHFDLRRVRGGVGYLVNLLGGFMNNLLTEQEKALNYYRSAFERKRPDYVPATVRLLERVRSDVPMLSEDGRGYYADAGVHDCESNQYGAISVRAMNGKMLGVKPDEFQVVAWRANT